MNRPVNTTQTTAWNLPMLADQVQLLRKDANYENKRLRAAQADYTPEGLKKLREQRTAPLRDRLSELTQAAEQWCTAATAQTTTIRETLLPTAKPGSNEAIQAELQAARVLNRGDITSKQALDIFTQPPSATRTLLIEELQARGHISADTVEAQLIQSSSDYREAKHTAAKSQTAHAAFNKQLDALKETIETGHTPTGSDAWNDVNYMDIPGASTAYDIETPVTFWNKATCEIGIRS